MAIQKIMTFEEFRTFLSEAIGMREEYLTPNASLMNDLAIDSLKLVELMLQFELQLGVSMPSTAAWDIQTVNDAHRFYLGQMEKKAVKA